MKDLLAKERNIIKQLGALAERKEAAQQQLDDVTSEMDELIAEAIGTTRIPLSRLASVSRISRTTLYRRVRWKD